ncbi:MAG: AAA family ATPase [Firmicutes bacterium]|nr:AAA family ATPase [Bacillota bacterium]
MGRVIAVVNQKGGTAKTTTAVNVGAYLAMAGRRVLLLDIDPQGNATSGVGVDKSAVERCMYDVLINEVPLSEVVKTTRVNGLDVVPATLQLAGAEIELVNTMSREHRLRHSLEAVRNVYDYCLVDCPPSLGLLTVNALTASDSVLVPIQCEYYALEGLSQLLKTVDLVKKHLNPRLDVLGVVLTMFDSRTNLAQQVVDEVRAHFGDKVFGSVIPRNVRLSEAPSYGMPIPLYDEKSKGAEAYRSLAAELMKSEGV